MSIDQRIEQLRLQLAALEKEKSFQEEKARKIKEFQKQSLLKKTNIEQLKLEIKEQQAKLDKHAQEIELLAKNIKKVMGNLEQQTNELKLSEEQLEKTEAEQYLILAPIKVKSEKTCSL